MGETDSFFLEIQPSLCSAPVLHLLGFFSNSELVGLSFHMTPGRSRVAGVAGNGNGIYLSYYTYDAISCTSRTYTDYSVVGYIICFIASD